LCCHIGAVLLHEGEDSVHHDHREDREPQRRHAGHQGERARDPQHQREEVHQLAQEPARARLPLRFGQPVRPVVATTLLGVGHAQSDGWGARSNSIGQHDLTTAPPHADRQGPPTPPRDET